MWDRVRGDFSPDEIDPDTVRYFARLARLRLPQVSEDEPVDSVLRKLNLLVDGKLTRGAILLFGKALREATINALIHRDYFDPHGEVSIRVYDDQVYIWNPGELPPGITVADLKKTPHDSRLRNPLLAQAFYYAGWIERWGSGTTRIVGLCRQQGLPEPEFRSHNGRFEVQFFEDPYTEERLRDMSLNERQVQAVLRLKQGGEIGIATLKGLIPGVSDKTLYRDLQNLVELGVLKRSGEKIRKPLRAGAGRRYRTYRLNIGHLSDIRCVACMAKTPALAECYASREPGSGFAQNGQSAPRA